MRRTVGVLVASLALGPGCMGELGDPTGSSERAESTTGSGGAGGAGRSGSTLVDGRLPPRIWRLTTDQFHVEARRVLGGAAVPDFGALPSGIEAHGLVNGAADLGFDAAAAATMFNTAAQYGTWAESNAADVMTCDGLTYGTRECAEAFALSLARRAYRRPPTSDEVAELVAVYDEGAALAPEVGVGAMVQAVLVSPFFLFRTEIGDPTQEGTRQLTHHEVAALLAFVVTGHGPDSALEAAADAQQLYDADEREAHVRRLFAESEPMWQDFFNYWLDIDGLEAVAKSGAAFPSFDQNLASAMRAETEAFLRTMILGGEGRFVDLFTSPEALVGPELAAVYGAEHPGGGVASVRLPEAERAGVLTRAAWLATHSNAVDSGLERRGFFVLESILCEAIPPPPPSALEQQLELAGPDATARERVESRAGVAACNACHQHIDPIGIGLENYDAIGTFRDSQNGEALAVQGTVPDLGEFNGGVELSHLIADSPRTQGCFAERLAQYALGADLSTASGSGGPWSEWLAMAAEAFEDDGLRLEALLVGLVRHPAFIERQAEE